MEINKNNWHAKFYYWTYKNHPNSLCPYFWKLILAFVLLPLTFVGYLIPTFREDEDNVLSVYFAVTVLFWILLGFGWETGNNMFETYHIFLSTFLGFLILLFGIAVALTVLFGIGYFFAEWLPEHIYKNRREEPKTNLIKERIKAFKGKYCPKITWRN